MSTQAVGTVLVGLDGSDESFEAAQYAIAIADRYDADLVALHVIDSADYRAIESGERKPDDISADGRAMLEAVATDAAAEDVECRGATAYGFDTRRKLVHPGSVVLDTADEVDADFIVLPRESISDGPGDEGTLAKAAEYALLYATQPVFSV